MGNLTGQVRKVTQDNKRYYEIPYLSSKYLGWYTFPCVLPQELYWSYSYAVLMHVLCFFQRWQLYSRWDVLSCP